MNKQNVFFIIFCLILIPTLFSQKNKGPLFEHLNRQDSSSFIAFLETFEESFELKDSLLIKQLSCKKINCDLCFTSTPPSSINGYAIPVDRFISSYLSEILAAKLWEELKNNNFSLYKRKILNYKSENLPIGYSDDLILYELCIATYKANEWAEGHEGQNHIFQFIKYEKFFMFYGFSSIP